MKQINKIFILSIAIIAVFGYLDSMQIIPWQTSGDWGTYTQFVMPSILSMWIVAIVAISVIYYIIKKDKSESIGIGVSAIILMFGGMEDIWFFMLSNNVMTAQMCWFTGTQTIVSRLLGYECVTPLGLWLNAILFTWLAYKILQWFFKQRSW